MVLRSIRCKNAKHTALPPTNSIDGGAQGREGLLIAITTKLYAKARRACSWQYQQNSRPCTQWCWKQAGGVRLNLGQNWNMDYPLEGGRCSIKLLCCQKAKVLGLQEGRCRLIELLRTMPDHAHF